MDKKQIIVNSIQKQRILPLFFYENTEVTLEATRTLYKAGVRVLEYTNRGDAALKNFKALKALQQQEMPDLHLGIGTIKSAGEAEKFIDAGADFIVAPIINPEVARITRQINMLWIPGCMTPTEIYNAQQYEAAIIKIFPANVLGPEFISSIREVFKGQLFIPTGGVELEQQNINKWFNAGVCAVGMGSKMISRDLLDQRSYDQLYINTSKAIKLAQPIQK